jgi:hypothetical protein
MPQGGHIRFAGRKSVPVLLLQREASGVLLEFTAEPVELSDASEAEHDSGLLARKIGASCAGCE